MSTTAEALAPQSPDAPVVPPEQLPDGDAAPAGNEADPSPAAKVDAGESPGKKDGFQARIDELTKHWRETERREREAQRDRDHWREQALRYQAQPQPTPKAPEPATPKTLADFNFDEGKHQAYLLEMASKAATEAAKRELEAEREQATRQEQAATYVKRAKDFAKEHEDYKEIAESAPISDDVAEIILGLDNGPEVAYHLGKNPDVAMDVSRLPPVHAAFELGQIAARLEFQRETAAKAKALVSAAPAPAPRIEGTHAAQPAKASSPESDQMSDADWLKAREKEVQRKKRN